MSHHETSAVTSQIVHSRLSHYENGTPWFTVWNRRLAVPVNLSEKLKQLRWQTHNFTDDLLKVIQYTLTPATTELTASASSYQKAMLSVIESESGIYD